MSGIWDSVVGRSNYGKFRTQLMVMSGEPLKNVRAAGKRAAPIRAAMDQVANSGRIPRHPDERSTAHEPRLGAASGLLLGLAIGLILWIILIATGWWLLKGR